MSESYAKREKAKKKAKSKQDKAEKMAQRKENNDKGKSLEDMMAYIDENGNLSTTPPDPKKMKTINAEDISLEVSRPREEEEEGESKGIVTYFNESKGYGFITGLKNKTNIFFHINQLMTPIKEGNLVEYETERTPRGLNATNVKKTT